MKRFRISIISIIIILILNSAITAKSKSYSIYFNHYVGLNSGKTEYILDLKYPEGGFTYFIKSQLEFPLDQTMIGSDVEIKLYPGTQQEWVLKTGFCTQANYPSGKMYDHDWWNLRTGLTEKISYTESDTKGKNYIILVTLDKLILLGKKGSISITGGFKYQKIEQDIYGLKGWQLDPNNDWEQFDFELPDIHGLFYKITYKLPNAGFRINYFLNQKLTFNTRVAYTRALITDFDDHLLRFKTTESDIAGNGLLMDYGMRIDFGQTPGQGFFIELNGDLTYIKASGTSTQSWYGDDPSSVEDDTGQVFTGLPHEINTTQFRFGIVLGLGI